MSMTKFRLDLVMHGTVSCAIFFCVTWLLKEPFFGVAFALLWGVAKEWYDEYKGGAWDWWDIGADLLGIAFGYVVWGLGK